jgi:alpha-tubulin suppressor-like RCC1 family protein
VTAVFAAALAVTTCATEEAMGPGQPAPTGLSLVAGDAQTGPVAQVLPRPLVVRAVDAGGSGVGGARVLWFVTVGGGHLSAATTVTDPSGQTSVNWTLGSAPGTNGAAASLPEPYPGVSFSAASIGGPAVRLVFLTQPGNALAGAPLYPAPRVVAQDSFGNPVQPSSAITLAITNGTGAAGALLGGATAVTPAAGVAQFSNLSVDRFGSGYTLTASATGLPNVTSRPFSVAASHLVITAQPGSGIAGANIAPALRVEARDQVGSTDTTFTDTVRLAIASGTGTSGAALAGTTTIPALGGVAVFPSVRIAFAGTAYRITASATRIGTVLSDSFDVTPAPAAVMGFGVDPYDVAEGVIMRPNVAVQLRDTFGNLATNTTLPVTVSLTTGTGAAGAALGGTLVQTPIGGTATFDDLHVDLAGAGYTLTATAAGLASITSRTFTVLRIPTDLAAGASHTCALTSAGAAVCWGQNGSGQLGDSTTVDRAAPVRVAGGLTFTALSAAGAHTCALTATGQAYCWGSNRSGELGTGDAVDRPSPQPVAGGYVFVSLVTGTSYSCGLTGAGSAYCWGDNASGQLGTGDSLGHSTPAPTAGGLSFARLAAGDDHACGVTTAFSAYCWGANRSGALGTGDTVARPSPTPVAGQLTIGTLTAGGSHTCGETLLFSVQPATYCWGDNTYGELGNGSRTSSLTPAQVGAPGTSPLFNPSAGTTHTCALDTYGGPVWCWGHNDWGQVGTGTTSDQTTPTTVLLQARKVATGGRHSCAIRYPSTVWCWGANDFGQIGDGTTTTRLTAVRVLTF